MPNKINGMDYMVLILLSLQDTLRQPSAAYKTMRKSLAISQTAGYLFYAMVMTSGYLAFGNGKIFNQTYLQTTYS